MTPAYRSWMRDWTGYTVVGTLIVLLVHAWEGHYLAQLLADLTSGLGLWLLGLVLPALILHRRKGG
ncbi:MAG: hypothetical protein ACYC5Y_05120 [Symbiobacteriia bacterium]